MARTAFHWYCIFDKPAVSVRCVCKQLKVDYGLNWFKTHRFSQEECEKIEKKRKRIFAQRGLFFYAILWPPSAPFFDEIEQDLSCDHQIHQSQDLLLSEDQFESFVQGVYSVDDIAKWKVAKKIWGMRRFDKIVRLISLEIPHHQFRSKSGCPAVKILVHAEQLKVRYRQCYRNQVPEYFYDILFHMTDNYFHNRHVYQLFDQYLTRTKSV